MHLKLIVIFDHAPTPPFPATMTVGQPDNHRNNLRTTFQDHYQARFLNKQLLSKIFYRLLLLKSQLMQFSLLFPLQLRGHGAFYGSLFHADLSSIFFVFVHAFSFNHGFQTEPSKEACQALVFCFLLSFIMFSTSVFIMNENRSNK